MFFQTLRTPSITLVIAAGLALVSGTADADTITVDTLDDIVASDSACSLREALDNANNNDGAHPDCAAGAGDDLITFDASLFTAGQASIELASTLFAGEIAPIEALAIRAPANMRLRLQASTLSPHRVLWVRSGAVPFEMSDIDIVGGGGSGSGDGVGVRLESQNAHFQRVHFIGNQTSGFNGGALSQSGGDGQLAFTDCLFQDNRAVNGNGGAIYLFDTRAAHQVLIEDTDFINNQATYDGGAIRFESSMSPSGPGTPVLDIVRSRFLDGSARQGAGVVAWAGSNANQRLRVTVSDSLFQNNQASSWGGGLRIDGNSLGSQSSLLVQRSSFIGNAAAANGGAIAALSLDARIENNLFSENSTNATGGAVYFNASHDAQPRSVKLIGNSFHRQVQTGSSGSRSLYLWAPADASGWQWTLAGNLFDPLSNPPAFFECLIEGGSTQPLTLSGGANLSPDTDCLFLGANDVEAAPMVAASNSGNLLKPLNLLPQSGSPAIDAWSAASCLDGDGAALIDDLRDASRPGDGDASGVADCDIGAFELPDAYQLDVTLSGAGTGQVSSNPAGIDCGADCEEAFAENTSITLSASASAGSVFSGWSGDCSGNGDCLLSMDAAKSVTASFDELPSHPLSITLSGDGNGTVQSQPSGIQCQPTCAANFGEGSVVTLSATAAAGSTFSGWSGGGCSGTGNCQVTVSAARAVTAEFTATHFPVSVTLPGGGVGSVTSDLPGIDCPALDCTASFSRSEMLTLSASANAGSIFVGWEADCLTFGDAADCELDMDGGPYAAAARFERERTLTVNPSGSGSGQIVSTPAGIACPGQCSATWVNGSAITLSASADPGSVFVGWNSNQCSGNGDCNVLLDDDVTVDAVFQTGSHTLSVVVVGGGRVISTPAGITCPGDCTESYLNGASITLTPSADPGFAFDHWSGDCSGSGACVVQIDQTRSVSAHFVVNTTDTFANGFE